jgi:chemotaxis signal transduction protein
MKLVQAEISLRNDSPRLKIATFSISSQLFAIEESAVLEVIDTNTVVSIPDMSGQLAGAVSYRGHYIAVVNTRHMLGHKLSDNESLNLLVIRGGNKQAGTIAMIVDGLHRVLEINESMMQTVPITSTIKGIVNIPAEPNKTIIVLDHDALFSRLDQGDFHQEWQKLLATQ